MEVAIAPNARLGERTLKISNTNGSAEARWEILPRLNRFGSFQGYSLDDVMYLIMIDRFSDDHQAWLSAAIARAVRSTEQVLLPRRRCTRHHRSSALSEGPAAASA